MDFLELIRLNLLSPMALAFLLGIIATLVRSDLHFPDALYTALSIYLLLAIGLKGGAELSATPIAQLWAPILVALLFGAAIPIWCYAILHKLGKFSVADSAAIAAHYGSVSAVTFRARPAFPGRISSAGGGFMRGLGGRSENHRNIFVMVIVGM